MLKFINLVKNEFLKILLKASTWIIVGIIILSAIGLNAVAKFAQTQMNSYREVNQATNYTDEINYFKEAKPDGYELEIERLTFLQQHDIGYNDWRSNAVSDLFAVKSQLNLMKETEPENKSIATMEKNIKSLETAITANDWKAFSSAKIESINADASLSKEQKEVQRWQYEYRLKNEVAYNTDDWKSKLIDETGAQKIELLTLQQQKDAGQSVDEKKLSQTQNKVDVQTYRLDHNIPVDVSNSSNMFATGDVSFWSVFSTSSSLLQVVSLLIIVIAGSCVASEFSTGTIKFLLINPVKRGKILMSKYTTVLLLSFLLLILFYIVNAILSAFFFGFGDLGAPYLYVSGGAVHSISGFLYIAWTYLLGSVNIIVMATLAFAISSLLRSSALAIGVSMIAMLAGNTMTTFLKELFKLDWSRYLIFANTDFNAIINGTTPFAHQTIGFAITVVAIYMAVFLLTAWDGFTRRQV